MSTVRFESEGPVAIVTIDRPEVRNAVDRPTADALVDAFHRFERDDALGVAVLTGADGTFCAGADLKAIADGRGNRVAEDGDGPLGISRLLLSKPVVAAVEGYAVAGGLELSLWCDLRVAAEDAVFGVFCRRWGVPLMDGGTVRLARLIGQSHALDLILTGRGVSGTEAGRMGLANRVVPSGTARDAAVSLARDIAKFPQHCMRSDRLAVYEQWHLGLGEALLSETRRGIEVLQTGETLAGIQHYTKGVGHAGTLRHVVLGTPMEPPFPSGMETALFATGTFQDAERRFWQADGVYTTAVGHATEASRRAEAVRVVFDPARTSFAALLRLFWESHDPTHERSIIYCSSDAQRRAAEASRDARQRELTAAGGGRIATEIVGDAGFEYAGEDQQQYLARNPSGRESAGR